MGRKVIPVASYKDATTNSALKLGIEKTFPGELKLKQAEPPTTRFGVNSF